jgi:hypothetical protein
MEKKRTIVILALVLLLMCGAGAAAAMYFRADRAAPELVEIKSTSTYKPDLAHHLRGVGDALGIPVEGRGVVMRSDTSHTVSGIKHWAAHDWLMR